MTLRNRRAQFSLFLTEHLGRRPRLLLAELHYRLGTLCSTVGLRAFAFSHLCRALLLNLDVGQSMIPSWENALRSARAALGAQADSLVDEHVRFLRGSGHAPWEFAALERAYLGMLERKPFSRPARLVVAAPWGILSLTAGMLLAVMAFAALGHEERARLTAIGFFVSCITFALSVRLRQTFLCWLVSHLTLAAAAKTMPPTPRDPRSPD